MRWLLRVGAIFFVVMLFLVIVFLSGSSQTASACVPTRSNLEEGTITIGTGPESDAYFAQFGSDIVLEKKVSAALIIQQSKKEGLTDYSTQIVIATALQESGMMNLRYGHLDSLGLFQQRPSQVDWGTAAEILDPEHAVLAFINAMKEKIPNRDSLPMIDVAIAVQNPDPSTYRGSWAWDGIAAEIVTGASLGSCAAGEAHLPLDPGYGVSSLWGYSDSYGGSQPHVGIDLSNYSDGTLGKPVYAAFSGLVIESAAGKGCFGNNPVIILHEEGFETGYLHMDGSYISVRKGDYVTSGQQIGVIGDCGQSSGPHLHYQIRAGTDKSPWIGSLNTVEKYGLTWLDPTAFMQHFGLQLVP